MIEQGPRWPRDRPALVLAAAAASFALGLIFVFVRAPHPWGWDGFDHYHEIALDLASGRPFPTMEVPWGYAYFLAAFYRLFGDHPWIPLLVQAGLNATVPLLVFELARGWFDRSTAILAAVLTGLFSFNTVYASTQSSDAICTCLFMAAVVSSTIARARESAPWFALTGLLAGIAPQFRPNLILVPLLFAGFAIWEQRSRRRALHVGLLLACSAGALLPWVARNYRLTHTVLPTSVHGGVQLWYGTLQVGPYLQSRAYNPRSVFEAPVFEYTSLDAVPIIVEGSVNCTEETLAGIQLAYWSDQDATARRLTPVRRHDQRFTFEIPPPHRRATLYYYFVTDWTEASGHGVWTTPPAGPRAPLVYFVSDDHLGDLDAHEDLLDIFDVARLMRHAAWDEPLPFAGTLQAAGVTNASDAVSLLMAPLLGGEASQVVSSSGSDAAAARMTFSDGSLLVVPRTWSERITDLTITDGIASTLMSSRRTLRSVGDAPPARLSGLEACAQVGDIAVNQVFYRREPHMMSRYSALALDNIRLAPGGFLAAAAYRAVRVFVIAGTTDRNTAQQFAGSRFVYAAATAFSAAYLILFIVGIVCAWKRDDHYMVPLLLILYVPATIAPVLTNMRYSVTVQPLVFMFIARALATFFGRARETAAAAAGHGAGDSRTARPL
jgi:Dolichyl-phosphate-mannose-protein mannosyltransferase